MNIELIQLKNIQYFHLIESIKSFFSVQRAWLSDTSSHSESKSINNKL